jgi:hypothetical protein
MCVRIFENYVKLDRIFILNISVVELLAYFFYIQGHIINILKPLGSYLFIIPTHAQFLQYYYFTPIRISAFRMPSS